ncbi:MAG: glycosyltransferase family 2 protein [Chloroflexota bacterium]|nr:glycosyltransferase family 2 protein [Chloroflexota bacterium]
MGFVRVSVIIPNWNGLELLRPCLDSLQEQLYRDFEVIVVDNGSTDGSVSALRKAYPHVQVLALTENRGYSGGCNAGIHKAKGDLLVMLNNDTEVDAGWLAALVDAADRHPEAGSFASRIMIYDSPMVLHSAGDLYRREGTSDSRGVWTEYGPPYDKEGYVFGGCGAAVAYRREMLEDIGLFEEAFFMYCEDVDLSWRAQLAGWKCVYVPDAVVYHHHGASSGGRLASYHVGRNTLWVIVRNYPWLLLKKHWRQILSAQWAIARDALRAWRGVEARARLRGQLVGLLTLVRWLGARRAVQSKRRVTCSYVESILE